MVNIRSKTGQQRQYREMILMMMSIEKRWAKSLKIVLDKQYQSAADAVASGNSSSAADKIHRHDSELRYMFEKYYMTTAASFGLKLIGDAKASCLQYEQKSGPMEQAFYKRMKRWAKEQAATKVKTVNKTTGKKISRIIERAMESGTAHREIAKVILAETEGGLTLFQALRIARTETHTATVASTQEAAQVVGAENGIEWNKYWVSAKDDRTRESHLRAADTYSSENAIEMDEPYEVGETTMMYPGDPDCDDPGETVNCRCVELYIEAPVLETVAISR